MSNLPLDVSENIWSFLNYLDGSRYRIVSRVHYYNLPSITDFYKLPINALCKIDNGVLRYCRDAEMIDISQSTSLALDLSFINVRLLKSVITGTPRDVPVCKRLRSPIHVDTTVNETLMIEDRKCAIAKYEKVWQSYSQRGITERSIHHMTNLRIIENVIPAASSEFDYSNILIVKYSGILLNTSTSLDYDKVITVRAMSLSPQVILSNAEGFNVVCIMNFDNVQIYHTHSQDDNLAGIANPSVLLITYDSTSQREFLYHPMTNLRCMVLFDKKCGLSDVNYLIYWLQDIERFGPNLEEICIITDSEDAVLFGEPNIAEQEVDNSIVISDITCGLRWPYIRRSSNIKFVQLLCPVAEGVPRILFQYKIKDYEPSIACTISNTQHMLTFDELRELYRHYQLPISPEMDDVFTRFRTY